jgi:hypothetical protein
MNIRPNFQKFTEKSPQFSENPPGFSKNPQNIPLRATLSGSHKASIYGVTVRGDAPVLKLCRWLIEAGAHPDTPLEVYRGDTLALRVRSIGEAAQLRVTNDRFKRAAVSIGIAPSDEPERAP